MLTKKKLRKNLYKIRQVPVYHVAETRYQWNPERSVNKHRPMHLQLNYPGKISESQLLALIPSGKLTELDSFGQIHFDRPPNSLIWADNLVALKCLLMDQGITGKVRLVYIDPPFATQQEFRSGITRTSTISSSDSDAVAYEDKLSGAEYLEFLRRRLVPLQELLASDGSIYVHIDYKMGHYVKVLMDEIFGQENFIADITRIKCNPKNFSRKGYGNVKDMILFYSKTRHFVWNEPRVELSEEDISRLFPKIDKDGRRYTTTPLHAPGETKNGATGEKWNGLFPPPGRHWRIPPKGLSKLEKAGLIEWSSSGNPRKKIFAEEVLVKGKKLQDVWELKDPPYPVYPTEKNIELLKRIIAASSNPGDIVLDCFAGSGTTLVAAEQMGRCWIGIDNSRIAIDKALQRLLNIPGVSAFAVYKCGVID